MLILHIPTQPCFTTVSHLMNSTGSYRAKRSCGSEIWDLTCGRGVGLGKGVVRSACHRRGEYTPGPYPGKGSVWDSHRGPAADEGPTQHGFPGAWRPSPCLFLPLRPAGWLSLQRLDPIPVCTLMPASHARPHLRQAWRRVHDDGDLAPLAGLQQRGLQVGALGGSSVLEAAAAGGGRAGRMGIGLGLAK